MRKFGIASLFFVASVTHGEPIDTAMELLLLTNTNQSIDDHIKSSAEQTVSDCSYYSKEIAGVDLPEPLKNEMYDSYIKNTTWDAIGGEIAKIYTNHLSESEMKSLIKFYKNESLSKRDEEAWQSIQKKTPAFLKEMQKMILASNKQCNEFVINSAKDFVESQEKI